MLSWLLIIIYLWIRFQGVAFGVAAVIALVHDVLVMLGAIVLSSYFALYSRRDGHHAHRTVQDQPHDRRRVSDDHWLLGERHDHRLRPDSRGPRGKSPILTRQMVNDATNQTPLVEPY